MTTTEQIREYVCRSSFCNPDKLNETTPLFDDGIFDSMGLLNLISFLEKEIGVHVEDSELDLENFGSIQAIAAFIDRKLN